MFTDEQEINKKRPNANQTIARHILMNYFQIHQQLLNHYDTHYYYNKAYILLLVCWTCCLGKVERYFEWTIRKYMILQIKSYFIKQTFRKIPNSNGSYIKIMIIVIVHVKISCKIISTKTQCWRIKLLTDGTLGKRLRKNYKDITYSKLIREKSELIKR